MKFRLNLEERKVIQDLLDHGTQIKEIAKILHRSNSAISQEIRNNGGLRLYNAQNAQNRSDEAKKQGNKDKNSPVQHLRLRVDQLEMKVKKLMALSGMENESIL